MSMNTRPLTAATCLRRPRGTAGRGVPGPNRRVAEDRSPAARSPTAGSSEPTSHPSAGCVPRPSTAVRRETPPHRRRCPRRPGNCARSRHCRHRPGRSSSARCRRSFSLSPVAGVVVTESARPPPAPGQLCRVASAAGGWFPTGRPAPATEGVSRSRMPLAVRVVATGDPGASRRALRIAAAGAPTECEASPAGEEHRARPLPRQSRPVVCSMLSKSIRPGTG